ncbi:MAG: hypothetical protein K0Q55_3313 [Verrucomicrobia bacterium]|jgi:hypothetical protein|nr:hypothetical protein [Verrucomicrobiota bacterium]
MADLDFPFPLKAVAGDLAEGMLVKMRGDLQSKCQIPVIVGDAESVANLKECWDHNVLNFDEAARETATIIPEDWLQEQVDHDPEAYEGLSDITIFKESADPMMRLAVGFAGNGKPLPEVFIAQLPGPEYWALPLHLRFGSWNACPDPVVHAAMARYWEGRYGARLAAITADTIEFTVDHPPESDEACAQLAREQYIYCQDIVDQGVGSVATLAQALKGSRTWFFWWD